MCFSKCIITKDTVLNKAMPELLLDENKRREPMKIKRKERNNPRNQETA